MAEVLTEYYNSTSVIKSLKIFSVTCAVVL